MAKMFYSIEEVQAKLKCSDEKIKDFVKEGMLREFRDGMKVLFKVDEVDSLANSTAAADIGLDQSFDDESLSDIPLSLDGSSAGLAGSSIGLAPMDTGSDASSLGDSFADDISPLAGDGDGDLLADGLDLDGSSIGLASSNTGSSPSYGLSDSSTDFTSDDSVGLADAMSVEEDKLSNDKDDTVVTSHGIDALEDTEMDADVDPLAQTKISSPFSDDDEISIDPGSSGSGLLDLSREADDTSLGADILKDIYSDDADEAPILQAASEDGDEDEQEEIVSAGSGSVYNDSGVSGAGEMPVGMVAARSFQMYDSTSGAFGVMLIIPFILLIYMLVNVFTFSMGARPSALAGINANMLYVAIGAGVLVVLVGLYAFFLAGNTGNKPSKPKSDKPDRSAKAKKEKKQKTKKIKKKR